MNGQPRPVCAEMDPDAFFPGSGTTPRAISDACRRCALLIGCTFKALRRPGDGYQAGLTRAERDRIRAWDRRAKARRADARREAAAS